LGDHAILRELGALRAMLALIAASPDTDGVRARQDERQKLVAELRRALTTLRGQPHAGLAGPARIADELEAVIQDSDIGAQRILTAAEQIDQAANNLVGPLRGNFERDLAQDIRDRVTQIFEACNFQDLNSQRIARVRASFESLDRQIAGTIDQLAQNDSAPPPSHGPRLGDETGHISQEFTVRRRRRRSALSAPPRIVTAAWRTSCARSLRLRTAQRRRCRSGSALRD
jgi:hypothetical protein